MKDGNEKILPHSPRTPDAVDSKKKETAFKFKLGADKRPDIQQNEHIIGSDALPENDQAYVKVKLDYFNISARLTTKVRLLLFTGIG